MSSCTQASRERNPGITQNNTRSVKKTRVAVFWVVPMSGTPPKPRGPARSCWSQRPWPEPSPQSSVASDPLCKSQPCFADFLFPVPQSPVITLHICPWLPFMPLRRGSCSLAAAGDGGKEAVRRRTGEQDTQTHLYWPSAAECSPTLVSTAKRTGLVQGF